MSAAEAQQQQQQLQMQPQQQQQAPAVIKKPVSWQNIALGAAIQTFEVSTLGQPFEVLKTHMAANRGDSFKTTIAKTYARGGIAGFYQGLIPWAWIEASTKGGVLMYASSEVEYHCRRFGMNSGTSGIVAGMAGGIAQAYTTMGFCTFMKTVEVTRHKSPASAQVSTWAIASDVLKREGIRGLNKGVSAVALRQMTNWGSRFGIARITEQVVLRGEKRKPSTGERLLSSVIAGALACWNQPIEVIRVEMQSQLKAADRPEKMNIVSCARYIYQKTGLLGFYRGVTPRIMLSVYLTVCMVFGGDSIKQHFAEKNKAK
ncbi:mitochondrial carrier [Ramicandelaber brevisporus]|nr:mitochondrial carrier [Ramicandelaber brevisporus]